MPFAELDRADSVYVDFDSFVSLNPADATLVTNASSEVRQIVEMVQRYDDTWRAPWAGVPNGDTKLIFAENGNYVASIGIGRGFIAAQGCGYFFIHRIDEAEEAEFRNITSRLRPNETEDGTMSK